MKKIKKIDKRLNKINKYLNLLVQEKTNGYLIIGIFDKDTLNTFGFIRGEIAPSMIINGVKDYLRSGGLIPNEPKIGEIIPNPNPSISFTYKEKII